MTAVVSAEGLSRAFRGRLAVDALTFDVAAGEVFALLGHNGAGKTTTLRMLAGVLEPTSGGASVFGLSPWERGTAVRSRLGVLPENPGLEERLTARHNLSYSAELFGYEADRVPERVASQLERFGLADVADAKVAGFSKGMKQRLALARALLHEPELLFLDEPTSGLDPVASRQVLETLKGGGSEAGRTVLVCTHDLSLAQRACDRVAVLRNGRLVALGTPADLTRTVPSGRLRLGVAPSEGEAAARAVREAIPEASVDGGDAAGELHVSRLPEGGTPTIVAALVREGLSVMRVEPVEPTLEDVYFALYGEEA